MVCVNKEFCFHIDVKEVSILRCVCFFKISEIYTFIFFVFLLEEKIVSAFNMLSFKY